MFNKRKYILPISILSIISWTGFFLIIFLMEPCTLYSNISGIFCEKDSILSLSLLYTSLFFALSSMYSVIGYLVRMKNHQTDLFNSHFNISIRQGILLAIFTLGILAFASLNILKWWTSLILFITILLIELNFLNQG